MVHQLVSDVEFELCVVFQFVAQVQFGELRTFLLDETLVNELDTEFTLD